MSLQYLSNDNGQIVAVQVPIEEWEMLKSRYPDIENKSDIPDWQKNLIDSRLLATTSNPERILPIEDLLAELDQAQE